MKCLTCQLREKDEAEVGDEAVAAQDEGPQGGEAGQVGEAQVRQPWTACKGQKREARQGRQVEQPLISQATAAGQVELPQADGQMLQTCASTQRHTLSVSGSPRPCRSLPAVDNRTRGSATRGSARHHEDCRTTTLA